MAVLRSIERRIEGLFEGVFGRAFRAHVQPVELARKLVKEMDDHRTVSVTRVYVPNEYTLYLSPSDREQFASYEAGLTNELQEYLSEHATRERYVLVSAPRITIETDTDLEIGAFGIATRMVQPRGEEAGERSAQPSAPPTMVYTPDFAEPDDVGYPLAEPDRYTLACGDDLYPLETRTLVLGRARECDIRLADLNVSRRHAEIRSEGGAFVLVDLGSTNGCLVNGQRIERVELQDGDRILIGQTEFFFSREQG